MPWTLHVKNQLERIFKHLDVLQEGEITVSDMVREMSAHTDHDGITSAFHSLAKGKTVMTLEDWFEAWEPRCQNAQHPDRDDLLKMRQQFGVPEGTGAPDPATMNMYADAAKKKKLARQRQTKDIIALQNPERFGESMVALLKQLHNKLTKRRWSEVCSSLTKDAEDEAITQAIDQLVLPAAFHECQQQGGWLPLDGWLASFEQHYRLSHKLTIENVMLLAEQLQMPCQLPRSPVNGSLATRDESPLFLPAKSPHDDGSGLSAAVDMHLTLEPVPAAGTDNPFMNASKASKASKGSSKGSLCEPAQVELEVELDLIGGAADEPEVNPFMQTTAEPAEPTSPTFAEAASVTNRSAELETDSIDDLLGGSNPTTLGFSGPNINPFSTNKDRM